MKTTLGSGPALGNVPDRSSAITVDGDATKKTPHKRARALGLTVLANQDEQGSGDDFIELCPLECVKWVLAEAYCY